VYRHAAPFVLTAFVTLAPPPPASRAQATRTATLRVGEAVNFATGQVTRAKAKGDLVFQYLPPQSPHGWRYNPITRQMDYQARVRTTQNYPVLSAAKTGVVKAPAALSKLTVGDVNRWTEDEYDVGPGRYILARGLSDGNHYLLRVTRLAAPSNDPKSWRLTFTYKPVRLALGAAGTAGKGAPSLSGTLTFREWIGTKKVIDLNLATGRVRERFDGALPSLSGAGECAYVDPAGRIVLAGPDGRERAAFAPPEGVPVTYGVGGARDAAISPDGSRIAVVVDRAEMVTGGGITISSGVGVNTVVVVDRKGKELVAFPRKTAPAWTPDGRLVVAEFVEPGLYVSDAAFRRLEPLPNAPRLQHIDQLAVSPDAKRLAFVASGRVWVVRRDGSGLKQLTQSGLAESSPAWSPDGRYIVLHAADGSLGGHEVRAVRVADGKTTTVVDAQGQTRIPEGRVVWH
jgi:hypothetical protein